MNDIKDILDERGTRYGEFENHAVISQGLKSVLFSFNERLKLEADQREALEMIAHKLARIVNGDPDYADSWIDIAGYAQLVAKRLEKMQPKERTWVGLTDEEKHQLNDALNLQGRFPIIDVIEAKLREKNGG
jgi:hypothetical protein